jgi:hypothetical protein
MMTHYKISVPDLVKGTVALNFFLPSACVVILDITF